MGRFEHALQTTRDRLPRFSYNQRPVTVPELEYFTGGVALAGADYSRGSNDELISSVTASQAAHTLRRISPAVSSGVVAVRALTPETLADQRPLMAINGAERLAETLDDQGATVLLYDEPIRLPVDSKSITGATGALSHALQEFKKSDEAADNELLFVGVTHPHQGELAFPHLHREMLQSGGVVTLEGDPARPANGYWIPRA